MVLGISESHLKKKFNSCAQWIATIGVLMLVIQAGIMVGWASPNLAKLTSENAIIPLTLTQASWVAAFLNLGRFPGSILGSVFIEYIGSEKTIFSIFFIISISWIFLMIGDTVEWLYAARTLGGISFAMIYGCASIYLGEVSTPKIRGTLISLAMCGAPFGAVIGTVAETYLPTMISCSIYLIQCFIAILLFKWLPESPYHLVKTNKLKDAQKSIAWYRNDCEVEKELDDIKRFVASNKGQSLKDKLQEFKSPPIRKATILVIILFIFPQMCGLFNIMSYMEIILTKGKARLIDPEKVVIYSQIISVISTALAIRLIDILGRRILLIISSFGTTVSLIGLGLHFYLLEYNVDPKLIEWLPIASLFMFTVTFTLGFLTVPSTVLSEIFPSNIKSVAACITSLTSALFGFVSAKSYQPMIDALGEVYVFWIHAFFAVLAIPCALFLMPETKGKTFEQIQNELFKK